MKDGAGADDHDLQLSKDLLRGRPVVPNGLVFLAGKDEHDARKALARILRGDKPIDRSLRNVLARLVDPDPPNGEFIWGGDRILVFKFRSRKRRRDVLRDHMITVFIARFHERGGFSIENAIAEAAKEFGLSEDRVKAIWAEMSRKAKAAVKEHLLRIKRP